MQDQLHEVDSWQPKQVFPAEDKMDVSLKSKNQKKLIIHKKILGELACREMHAGMNFTVAIN